MMRCKNVRQKLDAYSAGELRCNLQAKVEKHLQGCESCRQALARLEAMVALFRKAAAPPVPEGFTRQVVAAARGRLLPDRELSEERWNPVRIWRDVSLPMRTAAAAILLIGLALGVLMGRDTWHHPGAQGIAGEQMAQADPVAVYNLDYLTDVPEGALAEVYLTLASAQNGGGQ